MKKTILAIALLAMINEINAEGIENRVRIASKLSVEETKGRKGKKSVSKRNSSKSSSKKSSRSKKSSSKKSSKK